MLALNPHQKSFFETFGYLVLPGLLADDAGWITEEFEAVFRDKNIVHDGTQRSSFVPFVDARERLCTLLDHPAVEGVIASLLGDDFNYLSSDGNYYMGDTNWHPDGEHTIGKFIKVAFYLDPVTRDTGALRVIPGSHRQRADGWWGRGAAKAQDVWAVEPKDVPAVALQSQPGDLVVFNHNLMHSAFGGGAWRRMFTMNNGQRARTPEEIEEMKNYILTHCRPWGKSVYSDAMVETGKPERRRHLEQVLELNAALPS